MFYQRIFNIIFLCKYKQHKDMVKKAVLIGINYTGTSAQLNGCINDVVHMNEYLTKQCGFSGANIRILTDDPKNALQPTRRNMEENMKWLVDRCSAGDTLVFHFSGHGTHVKDRNGDETDGRDEALCPLDYEKAGVIIDDWISDNMLAKVPENATLIAFSDCCHSGTMMDLRFNYQSLCEYKKGQVRRGISYEPMDWTDRFSFSLEKAKPIVGDVCLFSGCQDVEKSMDARINGVSQGAFTHCLLETLKTRKVGHNLRDLLKEINCRLDIRGFTGQSSQLSLSKMQLLEGSLTL